MSRPKGGGGGCCDLSGLESRVGRPLTFLGLYNVEDKRDFALLPATTVAGDQSEQRILGKGEGGAHVLQDW